MSDVKYWAVYAHPGEDGSAEIVRRLICQEHMVAIYPGRGEAGYVEGTEGFRTNTHRVEFNPLRVVEIASEGDDL